MTAGTIQMKGGKILLSSGTVAMDPACCCDQPMVPCTGEYPCPDGLPEILTVTLQFTGGGLDGTTWSFPIYRHDSCITSPVGEHTWHAQPCPLSSGPCGKGDEITIGEWIVAFQAIDFALAACNMNTDLRIYHIDNPLSPCDNYNSFNPCVTASVGLVIETCTPLYVHGVGDYTGGPSSTPPCDSMGLGSLEITITE